jgi:hypothetical protein
MKHFLAGGLFAFSCVVAPLWAGDTVPMSLAPEAASLALNPAAPRLAVVISLDQFRADYLERFRPWMVEGGFRRLLEHGAVFTEAHHRHALTATAPGHATLLTGVTPQVHGIIANEWFDPAAGRVVRAIGDPTAPIVGLAPSAVRSPGGVLETEDNASPRGLLAETVGDQLKLRFGSQSRVISLANKDRAAVLMGGHLADGAYWMVRDRFVTSRYYRADLPGWVAAFNAEDRINRAFGHTWDRLLARSVYDAVQGPDDAPGEESRLGLGTTFPRRIDGGNAAGITPAFYEAYHLDPESSVLLGQFAQRAIVAEQLGRHAAPDLLCIGFSQTDYVGHSYGPDSHEMMDSVLRLDRVLADLFTFLDREVGADRYALVLTSDHGSCPLPEHVQSFARGATAGRLDWPVLNRDVETALTAAFGAPADGAAWTVRDSYGYRLVGKTLAAQKVAAPAARTVIKETLLRSPQIEVAWTRDELLGTVGASGRYLDAWRLSYHAARGWDVVCSPKPFIVDRSPAGTNHGTPYDYDNHVPLVWFGAGVVPGVHREDVGTDSLAPTLTALLGVPRPAQALAPRLF